MKKRIMKDLGKKRLITFKYFLFFKNCLPDESHQCRSVVHHKHDNKTENGSDQ